MRYEKAVALLELARKLAATAEGLTLDEMAEAAGCSRRTAERMRDAIEAAFPNLEALADGSAKRFRIAGGLDDLFRTPTVEEMLELSQAAARLRTEGAAARAAALESLEHKVRAAVRAGALRRLNPDIDALSRAELRAARAGPRPVDDPRLLSHIRAAIMALRTLRIRYLGGTTPGSWREVIPYGLLLERHNFLVAAEAGSGQPRNWRLDRIAEIEVTEAHAAPPADFDIAAYAARSFGVFQDDIEDVALHFLPHAAEEARCWLFHPGQTLEEQADGSLLVRFRAAGMLELAWHLFSWGDKVAILAPERLRQVMAEQIALCAKMHLKEVRPELT